MFYNLILKLYKAGIWTAEQVQTAGMSPPFNLTQAQVDEILG
jgi:adenosylmethionine-8-amino-7-oxononanoate aminotransferase